MRARPRARQTKTGDICILEQVEEDLVRGESSGRRVGGVGRRPPSHGPGSLCLPLAGDA